MVHECVVTAHNNFAGCCRDMPLLIFLAVPWDLCQMLLFDWSIFNDVDSCFMDSYFIIKFNLSNFERGCTTTTTMARLTFCYILISTHLQIGPLKSNGLHTFGIRHSQRRTSPILPEFQSLKQHTHRNNANPWWTQLNSPQVPSTKTP